jgi:CTP:phosphocholine cytidylyltransferase-like protein
MAGYIIISDKELGINIYIKEDRISKYIIFKEENKAKEAKLYLKGRPITFQRVIIYRGTTYYRAKRRDSKRWEFVIKFL